MEKVGARAREREREREREKKLDAGRSRVTDGKLVVRGKCPLDSVSLRVVR